MDKMNEPLQDSPFIYMHSKRESGNAHFDCRVYIRDSPRIAQLLQALRQLDESAAGLDELPEAELSYLDLSAIRDSGVADPVEALFAIAAVLEAIEAQAPVTEKSWSCWFFSTQDKQKFAPALRS